MYLEIAVISAETNWSFESNSGIDKPGIENIDKRDEPNGGKAEQILENKEEILQIIKKDWKQLNFPKITDRESKRRFTIEFEKTVTL